MDGAQPLGRNVDTETGAPAAKVFIADTRSTASPAHLKPLDSAWPHVGLMLRPEDIQALLVALGVGSGKHPLALAVFRLLLNPRFVAGCFSCDPSGGSLAELLSIGYLEGKTVRARLALTLRSVRDSYDEIYLRHKGKRLELDPQTLRDMLWSVASNTLGHSHELTEELQQERKTSPGLRTRGDCMLPCFCNPRLDHGGELAGIKQPPLDKSDEDAANGSETGSVVSSKLPSRQQHGRAVSMMCLVSRKNASGMREQLVASASWDNDIRIWRTAKGAELCAVLTGHTDVICGLVPDPNSRSQIWSCSHDHTVRHWDVSAMRCLNVVSFDATVTSICTVRVRPCKEGERRSDVEALVVAGHFNGDLHAISLASGAPKIRMLCQLATNITNAAGLGEPSQFAVGCESGRIKVLDGMGHIVFELLGHGDWAYVNTLGRRADLGRGALVSCSEDSSVRIWDISRGVCRAVLDAHDYRALACTVFRGPSGKRFIASCSFDGVVKLWEWDKWALVATFTVGQSIRSVIGFHDSGGNGLACGTYDGRVIVLDLPKAC